MAVAAVMAAAATGCSSQKQTTAPTTPGQTPETTVPMPAEPIMPISPGPAMLPHAVIYRTSAPSDSLVPVTVTGGKIVSFPAPTDLTAMPGKLKDGWLLDNRGINPDSRFTHWTYAEYKAMKSAPSLSEIMAALVPGITVTEIVSLPCRIGEATVEMADSLITAGLPGCEVTFKR